MIENVIKRDGSVENFDPNKIKNAIKAAYKENKEDCTEEFLKYIVGILIERLDEKNNEEVSVEDIQDIIENLLIDNANNIDIAKSYIRYRESHRQGRFIKERIEYMNNYAMSHDNAATSSETDANANVSMKNVANLEGEVYKTTNRIIQRQRMKNKLKQLYPEVAKQYETDLKSHIIYTHDEASTPVLKQYCMAVSLYPLMTEGVGNMDGVTPEPPKDIPSFSGQLGNLIFALSSQCKGAVAVGEYFVALNYYIIKEFGNDWYNHLDEIISSPICKNQLTVRDRIHQGFKQFVWTINQPAGNRGYQSPFTNISYYDHTYFKSLFKDFKYPDETKPEWVAISTLQKMFMKWFNKLRTKQVLTFPVETLAMVHNGTDIVDQEYKDLCAEMYAQGHSFFTYISDSADSLASCCRLRNSVSENTFSPTSGLTGVMTGSCNVITLNINRILQDYVRLDYQSDKLTVPFDDFIKYGSFKEYLISILERVYKYHIAFKTMLYEMEDEGMFAPSNAGYIYIKKLFSTVGINGLNEAARFLGLEVSNNDKYKEFLKLVLSTIKEENSKHSIRDRKRPFIFNSEVVPAEGLGGKNYRWDKRDGYWVPDDENLYNSYFYNAHDNTSVLDKFILHGNCTYKYTDGGSAAHINLSNHLTKEQYLKLIDFAIQEGTQYFTFNIINSKCEECGHIEKHPFTVCPKCGGTDITNYTRIIGYIRPIKGFGNDRQIEASERVYSETVD